MLESHAAHLPRRARRYKLQPDLERLRALFRAAPNGKIMGWRWGRNDW